jgi:hypothetical protein
MWVILWRDIIDSALNPDGGILLESELTVYMHLVKLVEAAHLIDVRETAHVRGDLKNRLIENY